MTPCHVHHMASVAKTWYATVALLLAEEGALDLDAKLASYLAPSVLDGVPNADRVTLRQLMSHTSGIPDFNDDVSYIIGELNDPTHPDVPMDLVDAVRGRPALGEPGTVYAYADTNYVLLALVLDEVTGDGIGELHRRLIDPLDLDATTFYVRGAPKPACIANTYWEIGGERLENVSDLSLEYATHDIGADGLAATPLDAMTFVEQLVRADVLTADSLTQMTAWTSQSADADGYRYGLGLARREPDSGEMLGHTGGGVGTGAVMRASPDQEVSFAAATNVGLFLGGPLSEVFDERLWDDLAVAGGL
jgi:D-alanyl-D-alanine carboxypeptidase